MHPYMARMPVLSGIDMALYDLAGKLTNHPVLELLGGEMNAMGRRARGKLARRNIGRGRTSHASPLTRNFASGVFLRALARRIRSRVRLRSVSRNVERCDRPSHTSPPARNLVSGVFLRILVQRGFSSPASSSAYSCEAPPRRRRPPLSPAAPARQSIPAPSAARVARLARRASGSAKVTVSSLTRTAWMATGSIAIAGATPPSQSN